MRPAADRIPASKSGDDLHALAAMSSASSATIAVKSLALHFTDQVLGGDREVIKMQLAGLDALVAKLSMSRPTFMPGGTFFKNESAHAAMGRLRARIGFGEEQERIAVPGIGDPHLRAVYPVGVAVANGGCADVLQVGTRIRFGQADPPAFLAEAIAEAIRDVVESARQVKV